MLNLGKFRTHLIIIIIVIPIIIIIIIIIGRFPSLKSISYIILLDVALAKCQRATIQNKY